MISVRGEDAEAAAFGHTLIELEPHASAVVMPDHHGSAPLGRANSPSTREHRAGVIRRPKPADRGCRRWRPGRHR
jgi:hypothetical protein